MSATYTEASEVQLIAEPLINQHHTHLTDLRVRMVYLFSDQEPETRGKRIYGDVKIIQNLNAHLAEKDYNLDLEIPTFVCLKCKSWTLEEKRAELEANADIWQFCQTCYDEICDWDWEMPSNTTRLIDWRERAKEKQDAGFETSTTDAFFVLIIYKTYWLQAKELSRKVIVNHLLCHCGASKDRSGETKLFRKPHDFEEFMLNVELFGIDWRNDLRRIGEIVTGKPNPQLELVTDEDFEYPAPQGITPMTGAAGETPDAPKVDLTISTSDEQPDIDTLQQKAEDEVDAKRDEEYNEREAEESHENPVHTFRRGSKRKEQSEAA